MAHLLLPMQSIPAVLRRFGLVAFAAFCLYPYFAYLLEYALHTCFSVSLHNGCLLPYLICTFGVFTRESFVELIYLIKGVGLKSLYLKGLESLTRVYKGI